MSGIQYLLIGIAFLQYIYSKPATDDNCSESGNDNSLKLFTKSTTNWDNNSSDLVQTTTQFSIESNLLPQTIKETLDFQSYHNLETIYEWFNVLEKNYPKTVQKIVVGKTFENREIRGVKLSYKPGNPGVFVEGGSHAREWLSPATITYIVHELLTSSSPKVRHIAENYDWYIVPVVNPDGYVYSHTNDRNWRKNRNAHGDCVGIDLNRNWNLSWTASDVCDEVYAGTEPFSEIEVKSLANYLQTLNGKIQTYLTFHSYSQMLLYPSGHSCEPVSNQKDLHRIASAAIRALAKRHNTQYETGSICSALDRVGGSSVDWVYGAISSVRLAFLYELRPMGWDDMGFEIEAEYIVPTGEETLDSLVTLLEEAAQLGYYKVK